MHLQPYLDRIGYTGDPAPSLVAQIRLPDAHRTLRGRVLSEIGPCGSEERLIDSADELMETLERQFHLDVAEVRDLWPRIVERHEEFIKERREN